MIYHYDGTLEGLFTCVFEVYKNNHDAEFMTASDNLQLSFSQITEVVSDFDKSERVRKGLLAKGGYNCYMDILRVFAVNDDYKDFAIYNYMRLVFEHGRKAFSMFNNPHIITFNEMLQKINYECHRFLGFVRFRETASSVMYAPIAPDHNILAFIMPHFADRYKSMPFAIYDTERKLLGLYNGKEYRIGIIDGTLEFELTDEEINFQNIWKQYYTDVSIKERESERRRKLFMPQRYWRFMPEINPDVPLSQESPLLNEKND